MKWRTMAALSSTFVSACGGGGSGGSGASVPADFEGIYTGTFAQNTVTMVIDANRNGTFIESSALVIASFSFAGADASFVTAQCISAPPHGVVGGQGTFSISAASATSIAGTYTDATQSGTGDIQFNLTAQPSLYAEPAALTIVAGTYSGDSINCATGGSGTAFNITIATDGTLTGNDGGGASSCSYAGTVAVPDPAKNAYEIAVTATCPGGTVQKSSSVAYYVPATASTPAQLFYGPFNGVGAFTPQLLTKQ